MKNNQNVFIYHDTFENTAKVLMKINDAVIRNFNSADEFQQFMLNKTNDLIEDGSIGTYGFVIHCHVYNDIRYYSASIEAWMVEYFLKEQEKEY